MSFSQRHYRAVSPKSDTPEDIRQRVIRRDACALGVQDRLDKYPTVNEFNIEEVMVFQNERIAFHLKRMEGGQ